MQICPVFAGPVTYIYIYIYTVIFPVNFLTSSIFISSAFACCSAPSKILFLECACNREASTRCCLSQISLNLGFKEQSISFFIVLIPELLWCFCSVLDNIYTNGMTRETDAQSAEINLVSSSIGESAATIFLLNPVG